jgi:hypothetical protein
LKTVTVRGQRLFGLGMVAAATSEALLEGEGERVTDCSEEGDDAAEAEDLCHFGGGELLTMIGQTAKKNYKLG